LGCFQDVEGSAQLDGMKYNFGWSNGARKCVEFCALQSKREVVQPPYHLFGFTKEH